MKKLILSASLIATFMLYVIYARQETSSVYTASTHNNTFSQGGRTPVMPSGMGGGTMSTTSQMRMGMIYRNGTYTGKAVDVYYGNVEVQAVIEMGRLTDVKFLQYPNDRQTSIDISAASLPALTTEAIRSQSATVDVVSGATATSEGFIESLGDALLKAKV